MALLPSVFGVDVESSTHVHLNECIRHIRQRESESQYVAADQRSARYKHYRP